MARTSRLFALLFCLVCARAANAQVVGGAITGVITDQHGIGIAGVKVTAHGNEQSQLFTTEADGRFNLHDLVPGRYVVTAALDGFSTIVRSGVMVRMGRRADLPLELKVVRIEETVNVSAPVAQRAEARDNSVKRPAASAVLPSRNPLALMPGILGIPSDRVD